MIESTSKNISGIVGHLFRHEAGKMAAVLARKLGTAALDDIDDIVQDTLVRAMETWKIKGVPDNPTAWLHKVAWHKAIDYVRSKKRQEKLISNKRIETDLLDGVTEPSDERIIQDSMLRMMFACCHPSIQAESQIAFVLKTLGGLSVREIAKAFLTSDETIAKRIYRAKEKMREEKIELDSPPIYEISQRLKVILKVLYLLFNEGYNSSHPEQLIREDLCEEAMRLTHLLLSNKYTSQPSAKALLALMCFQASRFNARTDSNQNIILLEHQDRSLWNQDLIRQGFRLLTESSTTERLTEYHVEASIASVHAMAGDFSSTNWKELLKLYEILEEIKSDVIVSFNKAITKGYAQTPQDGINDLLRIQELSENQYYHAALGNFYKISKNYQLATESFQKARELTQSIQETDLLNQKIKDCSELLC